MFKNISVILIGWLSILHGNYLENIPVNLQQPNGIKLGSMVTGDEYYVRLHDTQNYTIIQSIYDGYYYYAQLINNEVEPTIYRADQPIPEKVNFPAGIHINRRLFTKKTEQKSWTWTGCPHNRNHKQY